MNEYLTAIEAFYGNRTAERSGVPLMNHIWEGLHVLKAIGASQAAKDAFCIHPLFQADDDLKEHLGLLQGFSPYVMMLVMEYRSFANAALSKRVAHNRGFSQWIGELPSPGPLPEVRDMLIADKVQNYADFRIHHLGKHERSAALDFYFKLWLEMLGVDRSQYNELVEKMKGVTS